METRENPHREAWNKGKLVGQKAPLKPKDIWAIRIHLQNAHAVRDLAMFNLAIDSKLRGCDLVGLRVRDVTHGRSSLRPHGRLPCGRFLASCRMRTADQEPPSVTSSFRVSNLPVEGSETVPMPNQLQRRGNHCQSRRTGDGARHVQ